MTDDTKLLISALVATVTIIVLAVATGFWLSAIGPALRGSGLEFLIIPGLIIILFGTGYAWWLIADAVYKRLR